MMNKLNYRTLVRVTALLSGVLLGGCAHEPSGDVQHGERFTDPSSVTYIGSLSQAQAAAGAKADGTLYNRHFTGTELNSLGQVKLDLMLKATHPDEQLVVYLDTQGDGGPAREAAVAEYFRNAGVTESHYKIVDGPNTSLTTPTGYNLATVYKQDGGSYTPAAADDSAAAAPTASK